MKCYKPDESYLLTSKFSGDEMADRFYNQKPKLKGHYHEQQRFSE